MTQFHWLRSLACGALLTAALAFPAGAEGTFEIPPGAHFNPQKLERVSDYLRDEVTTGKIAGAILLIQQHGKPVYHQFFGVRDTATKEPMSDDTIFRLFSMTKPITSFVAMQLIEEGKISLSDPRLEIHSFLCQREGRRGARRGRQEDARAGGAEPAADHLRSDDPDLRHHLWLLWQQPGSQGLFGREYL